MIKSDLSQIARYNVRKANPMSNKTALLVIDMQKYFGSIAKPILEKVISLIAVCRKRGIKVLYTNMVIEEKMMEVCFQNVGEN